MLQYKEIGAINPICTADDERDSVKDCLNIYAY